MGNAKLNDEEHEALAACIRATDIGDLPDDELPKMELLGRLCERGLLTSSSIGAFCSFFPTDAGRTALAQQEAPDA